MLAGTFVRAPPKRALGELCFPLTKTYMEAGGSEAAVLAALKTVCPFLRKMIEVERGTGEPDEAWHQED
jgi:hypothetical protein